MMWWVYVLGMIPTFFVATALAMKNSFDEFGVDLESVAMSACLGAGVALAWPLVIVAAIPTYAAFRFVVKIREVEREAKR